MEDQKLDKSSSAKSSQKAQAETCRPGASDCISFCVSGIMSRCRAGSNWLNQRNCKYYVKSTIRDRCMHYIEPLGGHCDCPAAQKEARNHTNRKDDEI